jgi:hypothetical protein
MHRLLSLLTTSNFPASHCSLTHSHVWCAHTVSRKLKLIDLGGAADLRIGINYLPRDFLLDPRFCAPERFIMSTRTPVAPPRPIAALLSPVLWQLNRPDK